jgi:hypothetical protein
VKDSGDLIMMMERRSGVWRAAVVAVGLVLIAPVGCVPKVETQEVKGPASPDPHGRSTTLKERQDTAPELSASSSGTAVDVQLQRRTECRDVVVSPTIQERTEERTLSGGSSSHYLNGGAAAVLGGVGAFLAFGKCTTTPDATQNNPSPQERDCTSGEASGRKTGGYVVMGLAAIPLALIVVNVIRARDQRTVGSGDPMKTPANWQTCETKPIANEPVSISVGRSTLRGTTGSDGHVTFDLNAVEPTTELVRSPSATVHHDGTRDTPVDLSASPVLATWRASVEAAAAQTKAEQDRKEQQRREDQAKRDEEQAKRDAEIVRLKAECGKRNAESCYRLGDTFLVARSGLPYLKSACELKHQLGCAAYAKRVDDLAQIAAQVEDEERRMAAARQRQAAAPASPEATMVAEARRALARNGGNVFIARSSSPSVAHCQTQCLTGGRSIPEQVATCANAGFDESQCKILLQMCLNKCN